MTFWDFLLLCLAIHYRNEIAHCLITLLILLAGSKEQWNQYLKQRGWDDDE